MKIRDKKIKTLLIYQSHREGIDIFYEEYIKMLNRAGFIVEGFCLTLNPPGPRLDFQELDIKWKKKDDQLLKLYKTLLEKTKDKDVLILFNGANLHPELLKELRTFNVYMCFDDPESSDSLSRPVARFFDACFVGNIACLNQYYSWGCKNVFFRPLGFFHTHLYSRKLTIETVINRKNEIDVCFFGEKVSEWRKGRLDFLSKEIPNLYARGKGWSHGWVSDQDMLKVYGRSRIGINIHNSIGPVNLRTYILPANGMMQICDNKYFLGQIFKLKKEVIGYCDIGEVPEIVKFYLKHEEERKIIALNGWKRAQRDYNQITIWKRQMQQIQKIIS